MSDAVAVLAWRHVIPEREPVRHVCCAALWVECTRVGPYLDLLDIESGTRDCTHLLK